MVIFTLLFTLLTGIFAPAPTTVLLPAKAAKDNNSHKVGHKNNGTLAWSPSRRLSWEDFKGNPDDGNPHHALTAANLAVDAKCKNDRFEYNVTCVFLPTESWSKNKKSDKLLFHEQLHFDLTEVHARLLRKKLQKIGSSCSNVKTTMTPAVNQVFKEWKAEQDLFDKKSNHGLNSDVQQEWAANIEKRLQELEAYK
ncbi:DUF922 domain-containing protein [Pontibacter vulgaris]|uniref:DUF922 domain-containing protein n=1 Tax=Pontibacter vulgaris TaxID=2905679 RepID=UPI001FA7B772|nr:DUF922 domain-containing protein [Pontibacter vulgaris]